jgi:hypothetical protein
MLWHDMMVQWDSPSLRRLAPQADLVVWGYRGHPDQATGHFKTPYIQRLKEHGLRLWGAGAYKGADGHDADLPDLARRQENALAWAELSQRFGMVGLIATAWSRYATHMVQNEPIDAALDALLLLGVIFHDGQVPLGGATACEAALKSIEPAAPFENCREAMRQLSDVRRRAWALLRDMQQEQAMMRIDRRRQSPGESGVVRKYGAVLAEADGVAARVRAAFDGLMPPLWIDRYLGERIEPLRPSRTTDGGCGMPTTFRQ